MPSRNLTIERDVYGRYLSYTPVAIRDLGQVRVPIPDYLGNSGVKAEYQDVVVRSVREACGNTACGACVVFESNGAKAICFEPDCSMDPQPSPNPIN